jgi:hypothetical protein
MFNDTPCVSPCQRFVEGAKDGRDGVRCMTCGAWFLEDDLDGEGGVDDGEGKSDV